MDLNALEIGDEDLGVMQVKHPVTGKPLIEDGSPAEVVFYSPDAPACRDRRRRIEAQRLQKQSQSGAINSTDTEDGALHHVEMTEARMIEGTACAIKEVRNLTVDGREPKTLPDFVKMLNRFPWLYEQGWAYQNNRANFIGASARGSSATQKPNSSSSVTKTANHSGSTSSRSNDRPVA